MGVSAEKIGRKAIRTANGMVNLCILLLILLLAAFSGYALWDSTQLYNAADAVQYEVFKPSEQDEGKSFGELQALNPEVFAWLTVYGTHIDYPVTQAQDNMKYVNTSAQGEYSLSGSIFLDCGNSQNFSDFNSILYGHHMEKQAMFGEIGLFADKDYFDARQYGNLYYGGRDHGLAFFAFVHTDAYDASVFAAGVSGQEAQQTYLENLLEKAKFTREIGVTAEDRIVLLSTCSSESTNGRDILIGKLTDTVYGDAFKPNETDHTGLLATIDRQINLLTRLPVWVWVLILCVCLLLIGIVIYHRVKKHRNRAAQRRNSATQEPHREHEQEG